MSVAEQNLRTSHTDVSADLTVRLGGHIPALDGVRGMAIVLVMVFHFTLALSNNSGLSNALVKVTVLGRCGVDLFFVLSGFLITGLLADAKGSGGFFRTFYARRVLRIFPLYYGALVLFIVLIPLVLGNRVEGYSQAAQYQGWFWLHASNFGLIKHGENSFGDLSHLWSLAIEEHFYLLWPTVVFLFSRKALVRIAGGIVIGALALRTGLLFTTERYPGQHVLECYMFTPCRFDQLAMGAFVALVARGPDGFRTLLRVARWLAPLGFGLLFVILFLRDRLHIHGPDGHDALMPTIGYSTVGLSFAACLILAVCARPGSVISRFATSPLLRMFGKYSYALYIFHLAAFNPIAAWLQPKLAHSSARFALVYPPALVGCIAIATTMAWISWNIYEKRFLEMKKYFPYTGEKKDRAPAVAVISPG